MTDRPSDSDLDRATPDDVSRLVAEIRRLRRLIFRAYDHVQPTPGTEELQAELEREVLAIRRERRTPK